MNKLSLNAKFMGIVLGILASCCGISWLGLTGMASVSRDLKDIVTTVSPRKDLWFGLRGSQLAMAVSELDYLNESTADARKTVGDRIDAEKKSVDEAVAKIEAVAKADEKAKLEDFKKALGEWWSNDKTVREKADKGEKDAAREAANTGRSSRDSMTVIVSEMAIANEKTMQADYNSAIEHYDGTRTIVLVVNLLAVVAGLALASFLLLQIRRSINAVVRGLAENSGEVESASLQVAQSAAKLSQSTTEQAASLQQTAASAQEMTSMVQRNMENAQSAANITAISQASAQKGQRVVEEMSNAIAEINSSNEDIMTQVNESNAQISEITKVIAEIGNKTKVINDIVFQTKLLSFNASVEAARAGEHGRGFAVVAEEVGNLARMSGTAAKEISEMLDSSIQKVDQIVRDTKTNVERLVLIGKTKVEAGSRIAVECGGVLSEIVSSVSQVSQMSADISSASQEQAQGVQEISRAVSQLDQVTQTNASAAEQAASAADQLSGQARSLKLTVKDLLTIVNGHGDHSIDDHEEKAEALPRSENVASTPVPTTAPMTAAAAKAAQSARTKLKVVNGAAVPASAKVAAAPKSTVKAPAKTPAKALGNVESAKKSTATSPESRVESPTPPALKLSAGGEVEIPSEDDPRFKDV